MSSEESKEQEHRRQVEMLERHLEAISEHWDNVQIFVSRGADDGDGTQMKDMGLGNFFARRGQVQEWLIQRDEIAREEAREKFKKGNE